VYKEYLALLDGRLMPLQGWIKAPLGRHPTDRKRQAVLLADPVTGISAGREAVTEYHVLATYSGAVAGTSTAVSTFTFVRAVLHTGRTHQIRVHFAWLKHPVVGDTVYGYHAPRLPLARHFLHAHRLRLRLPTTGEEREFVAPLPAELEGLLAQLNS
jgi:23S rRNA pseudouridine1911/1915/1917 synthase